MTQLGSPATESGQEDSGANQALNAAVRQFKAAFAKELSTLPTLLRTTSATPNLPGRPRRPGKFRRPGQPAASPSSVPAG